MAQDKFPINSDIDFQHTIKNNGVILDLTTLDWYGIRWFYRNSQGGKVAIAAYEVTDVQAGFTENLEATDAANGIVVSHIQRADMASVPADVRIFWQPYTQDADVDHSTTFDGAGCEVDAGVSCDAESI